MWTWTAAVHHQISPCSLVLLHLQTIWGYFLHRLQVLTLLWATKPPCKKAIFKVQLHNCIWQATLFTWQNASLL